MEHGYNERMDNTLFFGLQLVQNAKAQMLTGVNRFQHVAPIVQELHRFPYIAQFNLLDSSLAVFISQEEQGSSMEVSLTFPRMLSISLDSTS